MLVLQKLRIRRVLWALRRELSLVVAFAIMATFLHIVRGYDRLSIPLAPLTIVGTALSIFLAFRNNAAYDRWWEARQLWGMLVNYSRTWARQIMTLADSPDAQLRSFHDEMVRRQIGYVHALRAHLRNEDPLADLAPFLPAAALDALRSERNVPAAMLHQMGERVRDARRQGWLTDILVTPIDNTLTELTNVQGACERIKNTPLPRGYTYFTHRITQLYCFALPFGFVEALGIITPAVMVFVALTFLILDRTGHLIENPFAETIYAIPLSSLTVSIETNLLQRLGETKLPEPVKPVDGVLW